MNGTCKGFTALKPKICGLVLLVDTNTQDRCNVQPIFPTYTTTHAYPICHDEGAA